MARVCFVSSIHNVHDHRFLYKQCAALVRAGHDVTFLVPHEEDCVLHGVRVVAHRPWKSRLLRILRVPLILPKAIRQHADVYHLCNVELLPVGVLLRLLTRRQVVYDNHEDFASFMLLKSYLPLPVRYGAKWLVQGFEWLGTRLFSGFVAADPYVAASYPSLPPERMHVFYNVPVLSMFPPNRVPWRKRAYDVVFLGSMSVTSGSLVLLDALAELKRRGRPIRALFIGQPTIADFDEQVARRGLGDVVELTGRVNYDRVPAMLDQCRIGLIGLLDLPKFHKNIATKMFEYWAKGMPVVSSDLRPERELLTDGEHGLLVKPGSAAAFADAIAALLDDPRRSERIARAVRKLVEDKGYYAEREMQRLADFYAWLLANPR